jgi:hypothetical protein
MRLDHPCQFRHTIILVGNLNTTGENFVSLSWWIKIGQAWAFRFVPAANPYRFSQHQKPAQKSASHFLNSQARIATPIRGQLLPSWSLDIRLG